MKKFLASGVLAYFLAFNLASAQNVLDSGTRGIIPAPSKCTDEECYALQEKVLLKSIDTAKVALLNLATKTAEYGRDQYANNTNEWERFAIRTQLICLADYNTENLRPNIKRVENNSTTSTDGVINIEPQSPDFCNSIQNGNCEEYSLCFRSLENNFKFFTNYRFALEDSISTKAAPDDKTNSKLSAEEKNTKINNFTFGKLKELRNKALRASETYEKKVPTEVNPALKILDQAISEVQSATAAYERAKKEENQMSLGHKIERGTLSLNDIPLVILHLIDLVTRIAGTIAVLVIIYGGFQLIYSGLTEAKEEAKNTIKYAIIGLFVTFMAWFIVNLLITQLTIARF